MRGAVTSLQEASPQDTDPECTLGQPPEKLRRLQASEAMAGIPQQGRPGLPGLLPSFLLRVQGFRHTTHACTPVHPDGW
jgi:hypothetical protein